MSCKSEIIIEQYEEATYIPIQAVLRVGGKPTVYLIKEKGLEPRTVETGLDNNRMVRIISGLKPGEVVSLTPPLAAAGIEASEYSDDIKKDKIPAKAEAKRAVKKGKRIVRPKGRPEQVDNASDDNRSPEDLSADAGITKGAKKKKDLTPEQREQRRQFMQGLSPEERKRFQNMSREEKRAFRRERMQQ